MRFSYFMKSQISFYILYLPFNHYKLPLAVIILYHWLCSDINIVERI